jgi:hypothetical protein
MNASRTATLKGNQNMPSYLSKHRLLTVGNPKTVKGQKRGYQTCILHLAPHKLSGFNVCAGATAGCIEACLNTSGHGGLMSGVSRLTVAMIETGLMNKVQRKRISRTRLFFEQREQFMAILVAEIVAGIKRARKARLIPVFRLNGTSDIRWETVPVTIDGRVYPNIMSAFPKIQFYDYTKLPNRRNIPANYHLTFSLAESNEPAARVALANWMNVAAVFRDKATVAWRQTTGYMGRPVYNGDDTDLRFLDPPGHIIALYAKGNAVSDKSGFVRD